jgi:hypothetical protein
MVPGCELPVAVRYAVEVKVRPAEEDRAIVPPVPRPKAQSVALTVSGPRLSTRRVPATVWVATPYPLTSTLPPRAAVGPQKVAVKVLGPWRL